MASQCIFMCLSLTFQCLSNRYLLVLLVVLPLLVLLLPTSKVSDSVWSLSFSMRLYDAGVIDSLSVCVCVCVCVCVSVCVCVCGYVCFFDFSP